MAETVFQALVIDIHDFQVYDQIITVLLPSNLKYTLIALGTKKILSKNARHLSLLNEVEIEAFLSNDIHKISKLKKVISLSNFSWELFKKKFIRLFLRYVNEASELNRNFYTLFFQLIFLNDENIEDEIILCILKKNIFLDLGLNFNFTSCGICNSKHVSIISIENSSLICKNCNDYKEKIYPIWFLKNFYYFFYDPNKISFDDEKQKKIFFDTLSKILSELIEKHGGFKCKEN